MTEEAPKNDQTPNEEERCGNCLCYVRTGEEVGAGECRESPPRTFPAVGPNGGLAFATAWPRVKENQWCADYLPASAGTEALHATH